MNMKKISFLFCAILATTFAFAADTKPANPKWEATKANIKKAELKVCDKVGQALKKQHDGWECQYFCVRGVFRNWLLVGFYSMEGPCQAAGGPPGLGPAFAGLNPIIWHPLERAA